MNKTTAASRAGRKEKRRKDRQADRQTDRKTDRKTDKQTYTLRNRRQEGEIVVKVKENE